MLMFGVSYDVAPKAKMLNELFSGINVPFRPKKKLRCCSGPLVGVNGLRPLIEPSRNRTPAL